MSALVGRSQNSHLKTEVKSKKALKGGSVHKVDSENLGTGLHPTKRLTSTPSTAPARTPLGNVSNTIKKDSNPKKISVVKPKPKPSINQTEEEEYPDIEYMPITSQEEVKEPFPEPEYLKGLLKVVASPALFFGEKLETCDMRMERENPWESTAFREAAGLVDNLTFSSDLPNLDDIIIPGLPNLDDIIIPDVPNIDDIII